MRQDAQGVSRKQTRQLVRRGLPFPAIPSLALLACGPSADHAGSQAPGYGPMRDPFPAAAPAAAPAAEVPAPASPTPPRASNTCGPACSTCSRAAETCDKEVRTSGKWDGPQCQRKNQICGALVALKNATGCTCD